MAWYTDMSAYHYLQYGAVADRLKKQSGKSKSQNMTDQFPRPTQESEKAHRPFQVVLPRRMPPPHLTQEPGYQQVPSKKGQKNLAQQLSKKKD
jgi:hypothetical protein